MVVEAPAKLNMSLRVLGRREDGFHELQTLMVPVPGLATHRVLLESPEGWPARDFPMGAWFPV